MKMNATDFKAQCLAVIDRVHDRREPVTITKRGRVVAKLIPEDDATEQPWRMLRGTAARWIGDPLAPVVTDDDIAVLK